MQKFNSMIFRPGRYFLGNFPRGTDLIIGIRDFCIQNGIRSAVFSLAGAVSSCTLGNYDQKQQVYVTFRKEEPLEIVNCKGNISKGPDGLHVQSQIILADLEGRLTGGCVFSETLLFTGELELQEIIGPPLTRNYDRETGRLLFT